MVAHRPMCAPGCPMFPEAFAKGRRTCVWGKVSRRGHFDRARLVVLAALGCVSAVRVGASAFAAFVPGPPSVILPGVGPVAQLDRASPS